MQEGWKENDLNSTIAVVVNDEETQKEAGMVYEVNRTRLQAMHVIDPRRVNLFQSSTPNEDLNIPVFSTCIPYRGSG